MFNDVNCTRLKKEYYECIQSKMNVDVYDHLKSKAIERIITGQELRLNSQITSYCQSSRLSECLNKKYNIEKADSTDKYLIDFYSNQFYKLQVKRNKDIIEENKPNR
jgi:hypothetical protein